MKHTADKPARTLILTQRILLGLLVLIILALLIGTVYAFVSQPREVGAARGQNLQTDAGSSGRIFSNAGIFTGIGRIRTKSAEPQSAAILITIAFPYNPDDTSFSEELASKVAQFRSETNLYFQALTIDELRRKTDEEIQRELLARYNAQLRLGFIDALYVTDYMIIE
ncbi:MAG: flagellar basal body protein FliL [Treponema sp.]|jgi:flagellar basal body-associated protein FliL|nr:flagellar basal body protein FliL [Treponema sp.]